MKEKKKKKKQKSLMKCWEYFSCKHTECPAYDSRELRCWLVSGTYCRDEIQGRFISKIEECMKCEIFKKSFSIKNTEDTCKYILQEINSYVNIIEESRANLEKKVKERTAQLEDAYRILQSKQAKLIKTEKLAAMGQLVSAMVHELNNPLGGMLNCVRELLEGIEDEKQKREYLELLNEGLEHIKIILKRFLIFSRGHRIEQRRTDINKIIEKAVFLSSRHKFPNQNIIKHLDPNLPVILADNEQLKVVFLNMIFNGLEAIRDGGTLTIETKVKKNAINIVFKDTGEGIAKRDIKKIFIPFFTTKNTYKRKGIGLGLSISEMIVRRHNGTIAVRSKMGEGTTFTIQLPINRKTKKGEV